MLNFIKQNVDKQTVDKINEMLKTPDGQRLLLQIQQMDKEQLIKVLQGKDLSRIDFKELNKALSQANPSQILNKLKGGK